MSGPVDVRPRKAMQAWQVTAENIERVAKWCGGTAVDCCATGVLDEIMVDRGDWTPQGAEVGDWVILDGDRTIVLPPEWFTQHYEITERPTDARTEVRDFATTSGSYRLTRR